MKMTARKSKKTKQARNPRNPEIPDPDGQNKDRAIWAGVALAAFQSTTGADDGDAVKDLLCDLMHYCQQNEGEDFDVALAAARHHHAAETAPLPNSRIIEALEGTFTTQEEK